MKKMIFLFFILFAFAANYAFALNDCYVHIKMDEGLGDYLWHDGKEGAGGYCADPGTNCKSVPCPGSIAGTLTPVVGGWLLSSNVQAITLSVKDSLDNWNLYYRDGNNYPFNPSESVEIKECIDIPAIVGVSVSLDGITTDENGNYTVFIPSGIGY